MAGLTSKGILPSFLGSPNRRISQGMDQLKSMKAAHRRQAIGISGEVGGIGSSRGWDWAISFKGQGGHVQTHSEGHFQRQSSFEAICAARDIILGPKEAEGHFQTHVTGHFQTQTQNPGVISKYRHTFWRQGQHFHDVHKAFFHMKTMW